MYGSCESSVFFCGVFVVIIKDTNEKFNLKEKCDLNFSLIKRVFWLKSVNFEKFHRWNLKIYSSKLKYLKFSVKFHKNFR